MFNMMMVKLENLDNKVLFIRYNLEAFEEKLIPISKSGTFIYETSADKVEKKNAGRPREDTRSLFDDPKL